MVPLTTESEDSVIEQMDEKTVSYRYGSQTELVYSLTYTGFKEDIIVREYTGQTEYTFRLETNGLTLTEQQGSYFLTDEEGTIRATLGDIIVFTADEKNNTLGTMTAVEVKKNQEYLITIVLDPEYLSSEATTYPIRIDPTIEISYDHDGTGAISDVTINSNEGSSATSGSLFVGLRETYGISRILMKFPGLDLSTLEDNNIVTNATVEVRDLLVESNTMDISCYVFSGNVWDESTVSWANVSPNSISTFLSSQEVTYDNGVLLSPVHRYSFDITAAVEGWRTGNYQQSKGIIFKSANSVETGTTNMYRAFASYNRSSNKPTLSVTYGTSSGVLSNDTY